SSSSSIDEPAARWASRAGPTPPSLTSVSWHRNTCRHGKNKIVGLGGLVAVQRGMEAPERVDGLVGHAVAGGDHSQDPDEHVPAPLGQCWNIDRQCGRRDTLEYESNADPYGQHPHGGAVVEVAEGEVAQHDRQCAA